MTPPNKPTYLPEDRTVPSIEVRGITLKQALWGFAFVVGAEATILGGIFDVKSSLKELNSSKALLEQRVQKLEDKMETATTDLRNQDSRIRSNEQQLTNTYTDRVQKKYDHQN